MEMYNPAQLSEIYGDWNPETYMQGRGQADLAQQFQREKFAQEQEASKQAGLKTIFEQQNKPQLIEAQGLANRQAGVAARLGEATEPFKLDDAKRAQALALPEHEIKMMQAKAQNMAYSPDPKLQAEGKRLMQLSSAAVEARQKHADEMEKENLRRTSAEKVAGMRMAAFGERGKGKAPLSLSQQIAAAKNPDQRASVYEGAALAADELGDDVSADMHRQNAARARSESLANREAAARVAAGGQINLPALNEGALKRERDIRANPGATPSPAPAAPTGRVTVISPDGKRGSIPTNQLEAALAGGYKKAQ